MTRGRHRITASVRYLWLRCPYIMAGLVIVAALTALSLSIALENASREIEVAARLGGVSALCNPDESFPASPSITDCLVYILLGMKEPDPAAQLVVPFNMLWAAPYLLVAFSSSRLAPYYGVLCTSLRSRLKAQAAFAIWLASFVFVWVLLAFTVSGAVLVAKTQASIECLPAITAQASLVTNTAIVDSSLGDMGLMILSHILYLLAMGLFAFSLARRTKCGVSFLACLLIIVGSAYLPGALPLPDITMIARSTMVSADGTSPWMASAESAAMLFAAAIASYLSQRKEELL